jgi:hypothetical protein
MGETLKKHDIDIHDSVDKEKNSWAKNQIDKVYSESNADLT